MGRFVNPGNSAFQDALSSKIYVDKTELISYTNSVIDTTEKFICNSRPRRFGKTMAADMLTAYYCKNCNSEKMFSELKISNDNSFKKYLNQYDVIHFDVQWCMIAAGSPENTVPYINKCLIKELKELYPESQNGLNTAYETMSCIHADTGKKFIVIIDEWDVLIRDEAHNVSVQEEYIHFLRGMFKGSEPTKFISLAYLTGILPIKKLKTQSALNNFDEFTMLDAGNLAPYIGFTENEVLRLSKEYNINFEEAKHWYDGYILSNQHIYNPKAVVSVMTRKNFRSYWSQTGSYEAVVPLINMDFDGLKSAVIEMISGAYVEVDVTTFQNDAVSFSDRDDVITYLIHLGYLAYDSQKRCAFIPNEEIRQELLAATKRVKWNDLFAFEKESANLLNATLDMDETAVAEYLEKIHTQYISSVQYNDENSLSSVLALAYLSTMQYYFKPIRELPTGRGFSDFIFIPKPEYIMYYPALLIELKWNKNAKTALQQIKERNYPASLLQYTGNILLVGISYDKKKKLHECKIEEYTK